MLRVAPSGDRILVYNRTELIGDVPRPPQISDFLLWVRSAYRCSQCGGTGDLREPYHRTNAPTLIAVETCRTCRGLGIIL